MNEIASCSPHSQLFLTNLHFGWKYPEKIICHLAGRVIDNLERKKADN